MQVNSRRGVGNFFLVAGIVLTVVGVAIFVAGESLFGESTKNGETAATVPTTLVPEGVQLPEGFTIPTFPSTPEPQRGLGGSDVTKLVGGIIGSIGAIWLIVGIFVVAYYRRASNRVSNERELFASGNRSTAVIEQVEGTSMMVNNHPVVVLTLRISPPGEPEFLHRRKLCVPHAAVPLPGHLVEVAVDPKDRSRVALDIDPRYASPPANYIVTRPPGGARSDAARLESSLVHAVGAIASDRTDDDVASDLDQLERIVKLHEDGVLTDEEFAAQKARILGDDPGGGGATE